MAASRQLAAIMFTDVVGFTEFGQSDEKGALSLLEELDAISRPVLGQHHGRRVKAIGDGLLVEFPNALDAVECAVDLQGRLRERNQRPSVRPVRLRIGIHLGDVERRGEDIIGDAVNLASRVEPLAEPGGVCVSEHVAAQVRNKVSYQFETLGSKTLKGVHDPVEVFRVVLPWKIADPEGVPGGPPRLAVLPLSNISPESKDEYFADGLTEELISVLSRLRGLRVIARTSVSVYKSTPKSIRQIGKELGVGSVLEGSVRRSGDRLRITLQLIDVGTEAHRWAETYDRKMSDVFEIQADVAERTAEALRVEFLGTDHAALRSPPSINLDAYELYLRGVAGFQRTADNGWNRRDMEETAALFEAAIAKDPGSAAAYAYLANLYLACMGESVPRSEVAPRIRELVEVAYRLNSRDAEVRTARGNYALQIECDWDRAEEEFRAAIAISPSSMAAHAWLGILLITLGRFREAAQELQIATRLDPLFRRILFWHVRALTHAGDFAGALAVVEHALGRDPEDRDLHLHHAALRFRTGHREAALQEIQQSSSPSLGTGFARQRAELLAIMGEPIEARALVRAWEEQSSRNYIRGNYIAGLYAALGEKEKALRLLEWDLNEGERSFWIDFRREAFNTIREDPRFRALEERLKLSHSAEG